jgi:class 3 adenylate cyclase
MTDESGATRTVTVLLCDLVGSTARQARLGDEAFDEFRRRFFSALSEAVATSGGEIVKNTGDGLLVVFPHSAVEAVHVCRRDARTRRGARSR